MPQSEANRKKAAGTFIPQITVGKKLTFVLCRIKMIAIRIIISLCIEKIK